MGIGGHFQVYNILGHEIDFRTGTLPLQHHDIIGGAQLVQSPAGRIPQPVLFLVVLHSGKVLMHLPKQDHLGADLGNGLEQHRVHIHMGGNAGRFGLDNLGPAHFKSFRGDA